MPVVSVSYSRLSRMSGAPPDVIRDRLPHLGLDIEYEEGDAVRVEYSPNRPDYSTEYGIAVGLEGLAGVRTGAVHMRVEPSGWSMRADDSVREVRGAVTGVLATGGTLDGNAIRQIISMQEDIHQGLGRGRRRVAIGLHDADALKPPMSYMTVGGGHEFVPLEGSRPMAIRDILRETEQGRRYGGLVRGGMYPVIVDSRGVVASMPPVINSAHTAVTEGTTSIFVDVTGHSAADVENALAVVCLTLQAAGFSLRTVEVDGAGNRTPRLSVRDMPVDLGLINGTLGLEMDAGEAAACLKRARLGADTDGGVIRCAIPPYRFDILGPMDLVEEAALGYGIDRMEPAAPAGRPPGRLHHTTIHMGALDRIMTGLGYTQAAGASLIGGDMASRAGMDGGVGVANPKSGAHTALRTSLLPGLLECLGRNVHEPYPHRLYETGWVFSRDGGTESARLACVAAHRDASYSEIKSILYAALRRGLGMRQVATPPLRAAPFSEGRTAAVMAGDVRVGMVGEIDPGVLQAFRLRGHTRAAAFELDIELIFGGMSGKDAP